MTYARPRFGDPSVKTVKAKTVFNPTEFILPVFAQPISARENFYRAMRQEKPMWVPLALTDLQELHMSQIYDKGPEGYQLGPSLSDPRARYTYLDAFGGHWTWDKNAGGACMTPGTRICDDILKWEDQIKFPDLHEWNLEEFAENYMKQRYDPDKALHIDLYHGPFQSLADYMGGFAEALEAMFVEPEACRALFDRFADWMIWLIDKLSALYPVDMFTVHDDWGTEKDAFFSPAMMEELLYEPTKRIIDHVHGLGKIYQFHCCGRIDKFMPYFAQLKPELTQIQRRVNDLPEYKRRYGKGIGFQCGLEDYVPGRPYSDEELTDLVRKSADIYAPGGGWLPSFFGVRPEAMWTIVAELGCYSRELYEKENA